MLWRIDRPVDSRELEATVDVVFCRICCIAFIFPCNREVRDTLSNWQTVPDCLKCSIGASLLVVFGIVAGACLVLHPELFRSGSAAGNMK